VHHPPHPTFHRWERDYKTASQNRVFREAPFFLTPELSSVRLEGCSRGCLGVHR
jgi:hypothetical protein